MSVASAWGKGVPWDAPIVTAEPPCSLAGAAVGWAVMALRVGGSARALDRRRSLPPAVGPRPSPAARTGPESRPRVLPVSPERCCGRPVPLGTRPPADEVHLAAHARVGGGQDRPSQPPVGPAVYLWVWVWVWVGVGGRSTP